MKPLSLRLCKSLIVLCLFVSAVHLMPRSALSMTAANLSDQVRLGPRSQLSPVMMERAATALMYSIPARSRWT